MQRTYTHGNRCSTSSSGSGWFMQQHGGLLCRYKFTKQQRTSQRIEPNSSGHAGCTRRSADWPSDVTQVAFLMFQRSVAYVLSHFVRQRDVAPDVSNCHAHLQNCLSVGRGNRRDTAVQPTLSGLSASWMTKHAAAAATGSLVLPRRSRSSRPNRRSF